MGSIPQLEPAELASLLALPEAERPFLLDVRGPDEFALAQLPGALLVPLHELPGRLDEIPEGRALVVYCHHGVRSLSGVAILRQAGREAQSLSGGLDAWSRLIDPAIPRY